MQHTLYHETYRPQFHFTARKNWLNDPNGMVYYKGEYHLFFQHNPHSTDWGHMAWGHAVSRDLIHWQQLDHALEEDQFGTMFSGSAVVDWNNSAGFQTGAEKVLVAAYTIDHHGEQKKQTVAIAYSNDCGRTWTKYNGGQPVLDEGKVDFRDPKLFWHHPTQKWIVVIYDTTGMAFYTSDNLKDWERVSFVDNFYECPDMFELAVDGDKNNSKWVLLGADGHYLIGSFDGTVFTPETEKITSDWGHNFYASQTFNDAPAGRVVQIAWMRRGNYPGMPFNQQMTFPCELSLRTTQDGIRLHRSPVQEIGLIVQQSHNYAEVAIKPGACFAFSDLGELLDLNLCLSPQPFELVLKGQSMVFSTDMLKWDNCELPLPQSDSWDLRFLLDRTSIELFVNGGEVSVSNCYLNEEPGRPSLIKATGQGLTARVNARELQSIWS